MLPSFTRKTSFSSLTKFWIFQPFTNVQSLRRFYLGPWQTVSLKRIPLWEESFWKVSRSASLSQENRFVFVNKIWHYKTLSNIPWLKRFDTNFWQTWKEFKGDCNIIENVFAKFQCLTRFFREIFFNSLTKFGIFQPFTNIQWLRGFCLGFWVTSKLAHRKIQYV